MSNPPTSLVRWNSVKGPNGFEGSQRVFLRLFKQLHGGNRLQRPMNTISLAWLLGHLLVGKSAGAVMY